MNMERATRVADAFRDATESAGLAWSDQLATNTLSALEKCTDKQVSDMIGYIRFCEANPNHGRNNLLATLSHDLWGIAKSEPCFHPRTSGYGKMCL